MAEIIDFIERRDSRELQTLKKQAQDVLDRAEDLRAQFFTPGAVAALRGGGPALLILGAHADKISAAYFDPERKQLVKADFDLDQIVQIIPNWIHL